jgi:hypothetical protein
MLLFTQQVFDEYIHGTTEAFTGTQHLDLLGFPDKLSLQVRTAKVASGLTSPTIVVKVYGSNDGVHWGGSEILNLQSPPRARCPDMYVCRHRPAPPPGNASARPTSTTLPTICTSRQGSSIGLQAHRCASGSAPGPTRRSGGRLPVVDR